jgi:hypothetical protein
MRRSFAAAALVMVLAGCATGYQRRGFGGYGFQETKLEETVWRVDYDGEGDLGRARDFATLRAAEIALENGYDYFEILDSRSDTRLDVVSTDVYYPQTTPYGISRYGTSVSAFTQPSLSYTVRLHRAPVAGQPSRVYRASEVAANIRAKHGLPAPTPSPGASPALPDIA